MVLLPAFASGGGYDRAIDALLPRVIKLYGLKVGGEAGYGTGVLISEDGLVLTVSSLLIDARRVRAVTHDGTRYQAEVVHRDAARQLAVLRLKPFGDDGTTDERAAKIGPFAYFPLSQSKDTAAPTSPEASLRPGDWVIAAGNPFKVAEGAEPMSIAHGIFSTRTRLDARRGFKDFPYRGDVLVIDAVTSNPGEPGSAVVNLDGEFVGMTGRTVISNLTHTHFNYAIPREVLAEYVREALSAQSVDSSTATPSANADAANRPRSKTKETTDLGIRLVRSGYQNLPPIVDRVRRGSPADAAGLQKDDLVLSINGRNVKDVREYDEYLNSLSSVDVVDVLVRRERQIVRFKFKPEIKP